MIHVKIKAKLANEDVLRREQTVIEAEYQQFVRRLISANREEAFQQLIDHYGRWLNAISYRRVGQDAPDVLQVVAMRLFANPSVLEPFLEQTEIHFRKWLATVVTNECLNLLRKKKFASTSEFDSSIAAPEASGTLEEVEWKTFREKAVRNCIESHGGRFTRVLTLFIQGKDFQEIAEILGINVGTVYKYKHDGQESIKKCVEGKLQ